MIMTWLPVGVLLAIAVVFANALFLPIPSDYRLWYSRLSGSIRDDGKASVSESPPWRSGDGPLIQLHVGAENNDGEPKELELKAKRHPDELSGNDASASTANQFISTIISAVFPGDDDDHDIPYLNGPSMASFPGGCDGFQMATNCGPTNTAAEPVEPESTGFMPESSITFGFQPTTPPPQAPNPAPPQETAPPSTYGAVFHFDNGEVFTVTNIAPDGDVVFGDYTLTPGGPPATLPGGAVVSAASGGLVVDGSTAPFSAIPVTVTPVISAAIFTFPAVGQRGTATLAAGGTILVGDTSLVVGGPAATISVSDVDDDDSDSDSDDEDDNSSDDATVVVSAATGGLVVDGSTTVPFSTLPFPAAPTTTTALAAVLNLAGAPVTASAVSPADPAVVVVGDGDITLSLGGPAVWVSGVQVSVGTAGVVLGGGDTGTATVTLSAGGDGPGLDLLTETRPSPSRPEETGSLSTGAVGDGDGDEGDGEEGAGGAAAGPTASSTSGGAWWKRGRRLDVGSCMVGLAGLWLWV
ncbi:hypothetical protein BDY21DRAFT_421502 [Lineolata rhizophorae]|uniref:Uncharacterized protein n=1 Tax=Lineolata rhizophorae TaxID=578093 RepID=A0A6A6P0W6_9PEZI|nr:hypothetical protein BDY21DRAFT_421502 [Lineolata rhizophorae]